MLLICVKSDNRSLICHPLRGCEQTRRIAVFNIILAARAGGVFWYANRFVNVAAALTDEYYISKHLLRLFSIDNTMFRSRSRSRSNSRRDRSPYRSRSNSRRRGRSRSRSRSNSGRHTVQANISVPYYQYDEWDIDRQIRRFNDVEMCGEDPEAVLGALANAAKDTLCHISDLEGINYLNYLSRDTPCHDRRVDSWVDITDAICSLKLFVNGVETDWQQYLPRPNPPCAHLNSS